jgi:hypothetical protein
VANSINKTLNYFLYKNIPFLYNTISRMTNGAGVSGLGGCWRITNGGAG